MRAQTRCRCAEEFQVRPARAEEYSRIKAILNAGKHPAFIGRQMVLDKTRNGGAMLFTLDGLDVAAAVVNPRLNVLLVLNVLPSHRGHGLGRALVDYLQCNFARVVQSAVPFFERCGYVTIGKAKKGNRLYTQVMVRASLLKLAGRMAKLYRV